MTKTLIVLFFTISFCACEKIDGRSLCESFYKLNKDKHFDMLYDVAINDRFDSRFNASTGQNRLTFKYIFVYDLNKSQYTYLPVFGLHATQSQKTDAYKKLGLSTRDFLFRKLHPPVDTTLEASYIAYTDNLLKTYYEIKTPSEHNNENVKIIGNPASGKFICFELTDKINCYYVADRASLSDYYARFFNDSRKLGDHWYYQEKR